MSPNSHAARFVDVPGPVALGGLVVAVLVASGLVAIRSGPTVTLVRTYANPLFRAAGLDVNLVRIIMLRDAAINSFVSTGNRLFIKAGSTLRAALIRDGNIRETREEFCMPKLFGRFAGLALGVALLVAAGAAAADGFTASQRAEIVDIMRAALKSDPSILRDAITALQEEDGVKQQAAARAAIGNLDTALTRTPADPVDGNPQGDVTVVEFFDLRCPYCRRMTPVIADLLKRDRNIRLVLKDIPILGPPSVLGARALLAAQKQGGYFRLKEAVMAGPADITEATLRAAAGKAGLDWDRLQKDMADPSVQARIDANLLLARKLEIQGTPAYVIGDRLLPGAVQLADLQGAVAEARKR